MNYIALFNLKETTFHLITNRKKILKILIIQIKKVFDKFGTPYTRHSTFNP